MNNAGAILRHLGSAIREQRLNRGWSQEDLALEAGLHRTYIGSIERGQRNVSVVNLEKIARALDLEVSELLRAAEARDAVDD